MPLTTDEKSAIVADAKKILDTAEAEKRDLTANEKTEYDNILEQLDWQSRGTRMPTGDGQGARSAANTWTDRATGQPVRVYRHDEPLDTEQSAYVADNVRASEISVGRLLRGHLLNDWHGAEAEHRMVREQRAMTGATPSVGGYLIPSPVSDRIIQAVRNQLALNRAGIQTIEMPGRYLDLAAVSGEPTAYQVGEGSSGTYSDLSFNRVQLQARKTMVLVKVSRELLQDASNVEQALEDAMVAAIKEKIDLMGLEGTGAGEEYTGIYNWPGVSLNDVSGALTRFDHLATSFYHLVGQNVNEASIAMIHNADVARWLALKVNNATDYLSLERVGPMFYERIRKVHSEQVATVSSASKIFWGDFSHAALGVCRGVELDFSAAGYDGTRETWDSNQISFRAIFRGDFAILRAASFRVDHGITG